MKLTSMSEKNERNTGGNGRRRRRTSIMALKTNTRHLAEEKRNAKHLEEEDEYKELAEEEDERKKLRKKKMNGRRVALFYLKLMKDNFVHSLKVLGAPTM